MAEPEESSEEQRAERARLAYEKVMRLARELEETIAKLKLAQEGG